MFSGQSASLCNNFLTGADCVPIGSSGLTHLVVSDNAELDNIPVTPSRVKVVKQQVCVCVRVCVHICNHTTYMFPQYFNMITEAWQHMKSVSNRGT